MSIFKWWVYLRSPRKENICNNKNEKKIYQDSLHVAEAV